jgi:hypothetical protein
LQFCIWLGAWWNSVYAWRCVLASFYYDVTIKSKFAADESIFSSMPDLSFISSSTLDLSILFTSEVLFLMYFEFYQHSTPVVSSNQILGILEVFNAPPIIKLLLLQNCTRCTRFSFMVPQPYFQIALSYTWYCLGLLYSSKLEVHGGILLTWRRVTSSIHCKISRRWKRQSGNGLFIMIIKHLKLCH